MSFKIGQKAIRVSRLSTVPHCAKSAKAAAPQINEIVTVNYMEDFHGILFLGFEEFDSETAFNARDYRPIDEYFLSEKIKVTEEEPITV